MVMMDFLDPRKRRAHARRLFIGYALVSVVIVLGTWLLFKATEGYGVDPRTGNIIQNSLLFVGSRPSGSNIYIDGKLLEAKTSARLILPAGKYNLSIQRDGYHTWQRDITLAEQAVARFTYPLLFPVDTQIQQLKNYPSKQLFLSQSPNSRFLLVHNPNDDPATLRFDEYDTASPARPPRTLTPPNTLLVNPRQPQSQIREIEWSADGNNLLLEYSSNQGKEFIIFNRADPTRSVNVNQLFNIRPSSVSLRNRSASQLYVYFQDGGRLQVADIERQTLTDLLSNVLAFQTRGQNIVSYMSPSSESTDLATANIWDGARSYQLANLKAGSVYPLGIGQYRDDLYFIFGSDREDRLTIYKDPLDAIRDSAAGTVSPRSALPLKGATKVLNSPNFRFMTVLAGQKLAVYDMETADTYMYTIKSPLNGQLRWLDGFRLVGNSQGRLLILDYDNTNQWQAVAAAAESGFVDRDYRYLFVTQDTNDGTALATVNLRAD